MRIAVIVRRLRQALLATVDEVAVLEPRENRGLREHLEEIFAPGVESAAGPTTSTVTSPRRADSVNSVPIESAS